MIIAGLIALFVSLFTGTLTTVAGLVGAVWTYDSLSVIGEFCSIGSWIVGSDLLLVIGGSVVFWFGVKTTLGVLLFIWRLLPFT